MERLRAAMEKSGDSYWAGRTGEQILAVSAWVALGEGAADQAVALMRKAADSEDASIKHVAMENRLYPMRELLADLLLEANRAKEAVVEYERALKLTPNRYRGLYGAARAAGREPRDIRRLLNVGPDVARPDVLADLATRHGVDTFIVTGDDEAFIEELGSRIAPEARALVAERRARGAVE